MAAEAGAAAASVAGVKRKSVTKSASDEAQITTRTASTAVACTDSGCGSDDTTLHVDQGHRFGNFPNYYSFHNVEDRLDLLTASMISTMLDDCEGEFTIMDIGCNDGTLTKALHNKVVAVVASRGLAIRVRTLGMEVDPMLVERARSSIMPSADGAMRFEAVDVTDEPRVSAVASTFLGTKSATMFSLVTVFSTTMWIHVNHGDASFLCFIDHLKRLSHRLVIEPQPWRCYRQAATRLRRQRKAELVCYEEVAARSDKVIENFIVGAVCGTLGLSVTETEHKDDFSCVVLSDAAGSWERKVLLFERSKE